MSRKKRARNSVKAQSAATREPQGRKATAGSLAAAAPRRDDARENAPGLTLEQRRAAFALGKVRKAAAEACAKDYRAHVRNLPAVVLANGLGQAIALELAQSARSDGEGHGLLLDHVTAWLVESDGWGTSSPYLGKATTDEEGRYHNTDLIKAIISGSDRDFVRSQMEVMGFLKWLKTFAEALIETRDAGNGSETETRATG